jgi:hypothetical protein
MQKTYCEKTSKNTFGIHITNRELGPLCDLLNSTNHPDLKSLQKYINEMIRSETIFDLFIREQLVICESCSGHGKILEPHEIKFESTIKTCNTCKGSGKMKLTITQRWEPYNPINEQNIISCHNLKSIKFFEK